MKVKNKTIKDRVYITKKDMLRIVVKKSGGLDKALKELKRKLSKIGITEELRDRQAFTKKILS